MPIPAPLGVWFTCTLLELGTSTSPSFLEFTIMILIRIKEMIKMVRNSRSIRESLSFMVIEL